MEHSIQQIARAAGTTSRTLRHYDAIGLLAPSRIGANGYRFYDDSALLRLQRILLLKELGLGLEAIAEVLAAQESQGADTAKTSATSESAQDHRLAEIDILTSHLALLEREHERVAAQIGSVQRTIAALRRTAANAQQQESSSRKPDIQELNLMAENIFEGFDHTAHKEEVEQRWGAAAYQQSDAWWRSLSKRDQHEWKAAVAELSRDWTAAAERDEDPTGQSGQALAARHVAWLRSVPGTPAADPEGDLRGYVLGLAEMYVADARFAANYGGTKGAEFVRAALIAYVGSNAN